MPLPATARPQRTREQAICRAVAIFSHAGLNPGAAPTGASESEVPVPEVGVPGHLPSILLFINNNPGAEARVPTTAAQTMANLGWQAERKEREGSKLAGNLLKVLEFQVSSLHRWTLAF